MRTFEDSISNIVRKHFEPLTIIVRNLNRSSGGGGRNVNADRVMLLEPKESFTGENQRRRIAGKRLFYQDTSDPKITFFGTLFNEIPKTAFNCFVVKRFFTFGR